MSTETISDNKSASAQQPLLSTEYFDTADSLYPDQNLNNTLFPTNAQPIQSPKPLTVPKNSQPALDGSSLSTVLREDSSRSITNADKTAVYLDTAPRNIVGNWGTLLVYGFPDGNTPLLQSIFSCYGRIQRIYKGCRISVYGVVFFTFNEAELALKSLNRATFSYDAPSTEPPFTLELVLYGSYIALEALFPQSEFVLEYQAPLPASSTSSSSSSSSSSPPRIILPSSSPKHQQQQFHGSPLVAVPPATSPAAACGGAPQKISVGHIAGANGAAGQFGGDDGEYDGNLSTEELSLIEGMQGLNISGNGLINGGIEHVGTVPQPLTRGYSAQSYGLVSYGINPTIVNVNPTITSIYMKSQQQQQQQQQQQKLQYHYMINPSSATIPNLKYNVNNCNLNWQSQQQQQQQQQQLQQKQKPRQLVPSPHSHSHQKKVCCKCSAYSQQSPMCSKFGHPHVVSAKPKRKYDPCFSVNVINGAVCDPRTTLMIRNIPNRYTQQMILESLDICLLGKYNFFYLPIDFQNQCNVGYAFINMTNIVYIPMLYEMFHNKGWKLFKSEKICQVTYARIQGLQNLVDHFKSSSLLSEDEKVRPIVLVNGKLVPFPVNANIMVRRVGDREIISL